MNLALNTPFGDYRNDVLCVLKAVRDLVEKRRGTAEVAAYYERRYRDEEDWFGISIDGKKAWRKVDSRVSVWRAVDEMIDELWPLELTQP